MTSHKIIIANKKLMSVVKNDIVFILYYTGVGSICESREKAETQLEGDVHRGLRWNAQRPEVSFEVEKEIVSPYKLELIINPLKCLKLEKRVWNYEMSYSLMRERKYSAG